MFSTIKDAVLLHSKDMFDEDIDLNSGRISNISYSLPTMESYADNILRLDESQTRQQLFLLEDPLLRDLPDDAKDEMRSAFALTATVPIIDQLIYFFEGQPIYLDLSSLSTDQVIHSLLRDKNLIELSLNSTLIIKCKNSIDSPFLSFVRFLASNFQYLSVYRSIFDSLLNNVIYLCLRNLQRLIEIPAKLLESERIPDNYIFFDEIYKRFIHETFVQHQEVTGDAFKRVHLIQQELDPKMNKIDALKQFFSTTENKKLAPLSTRISIPYVFAYMNGPCKYSILEDKIHYFGAYINKLSPAVLSTLDYPYLRYFVSEESVRIGCIEKLLSLPMHKQFGEAIVEKKLYSPKYVVKYLSVFTENIYVSATWTNAKKSVNPLLKWIEYRNQLLNKTRYPEIAAAIRVPELSSVSVEILARVFAYLNVTSILDCSYHFGEALLASIPYITKIASYTGVADSKLHPLIEQNLSELQPFITDRNIKFEFLNELPKSTKAKCVYWYQIPEQERQSDPEIFKSMLKLVKGNMYLVIVTDKPFTTPSGFVKTFEVLISEAGQKVQVFTPNRVKQFVFSNGIPVLNYGLDLANVAATSLVTPGAKYVVGLASDPVYNCVLLRMFRRRERFFAYTVGSYEKFSYDVRNYLHRNNITLKYYANLAIAQAECVKSNQLNEEQVDLTPESIQRAYAGLNFPELSKTFGNKRLILSNANPVLTNMIVESKSWTTHIIDVSNRPAKTIMCSVCSEQFITDLIFLTYLKDVPKSGDDLAVLF